MLRGQVQTKDGGGGSGAGLLPSVLLQQGEQGPKGEKGDPGVPGEPVSTLRAAPLPLSLCAAYRRPRALWRQA